MTNARIAPEQMAADNTLRESLEASLKGWREELRLIESLLIDQALIDGKVSQEKSSRYIALEKRETDLKAMIYSAEGKLGDVTDRAKNTFGKLVNAALNQAKPVIASGEITFHQSLGPAWENQMMMTSKRELIKLLRDALTKLQEGGQHVIH